MQMEDFGEEILIDKSIYVLKVVNSMKRWLCQFRK